MSTPLTRRQAREIERRTGSRPVAHDAGTATPNGAAASSAWDTGRIERNALTSILSVVPPVVVADAAAADPIPATFAGQRALTVRAPKPKQLVARRRVAGGLAVAASLAAVTAAGVVVPSTMAAPASQASLLSAAEQAPATVDDTSSEPGSDAASVEAAIAEAVQKATPAVAAPETVTDRTETSVVTLSPDQVEAVPTPEPTATTDSSSSESSSSGSSSAKSASTGAAPSQSTVGANVVETASQFIGVSPYVFGGATPAGFDCSGLVKYVYGLHGINLGHGVSAQAAAGTRVSDPQPGDLVIFPNFHVGIYAGNGQMIDAPTEGRNVELGGLDAGGSYYFVRI